MDWFFALCRMARLIRHLTGRVYYLSELNGVNAESNEAISIALQKDGAFLVCGAFVVGTTVSSYVIRYKENGELDSSFNNGRPVIITDPGFEMTAAATLSVRESDGEIVVVGPS